MNLEEFSYPRKARKYLYSCQYSIGSKMTLTLECRLRLLWQAKLALPTLPASQVDLNKMLAGNANSRYCSNQLIPAYFANDLIGFFVSFVPFVEKLLF